MHHDILKILYKSLTGPSEYDIVYSGNDIIYIYDDYENVLHTLHLLSCELAHTWFSKKKLLKINSLANIHFFRGNFNYANYIPFFRPKKTSSVKKGACKEVKQELKWMINERR